MEACPEEIKLYESLLLKKKLRGLDDLFYFNKYILESDPERRKLIVPHVHGDWATWFATAESRVRVILVPRHTFKSTFFTIGWSLQQIAKNRNIRILIANATLANSQRFIGEIKYHLQNNEIFKMLYGEMFDPKLKWNEDEIVVKGRNRGIREATITAVGVGGNLVSQHYDIIIADDLVNDANSGSRYQALKVIDWWKKSFSLLSPTGIMLVIGTRWSYFELYYHLIKEYKDKFDFYIRGAKNKDGSFYFPEIFNQEKLDELKELHGSHIYSCFFENDPIDRDTAAFKESQVAYFGPGEVQKLPELVNTFSMCDPAVSQLKGGDDSTIVTVSIDAIGRWFVREVRRGQWTVSQLIEELFSVYRRWQPQTITLEVIGQAQVLLSPIHDEEEKRKIYLPIKTIKARNQVSKEARVRSILQPVVEQGVFFIDKNMENKEELVNELLRFPHAEHDDIIDALSDFADISFAPNEKKEEEKPKSYFESQLQARFKKKKVYVDPVLGEYF